MQFLLSGTINILRLEPHSPIHHTCNADPVFIIIRPLERRNAWSKCYQSSVIQLIRNPARGHNC